MTGRSTLQPYTITISYTDRELQPAIESTLSIFYWNGNQWVEEGDVTVDLTAKQIAATLQHFSSWAVLGETKHLFLPLITRGQ